MSKLRMLVLAAGAVSLLPNPAAVAQVATFQLDPAVSILEGGGTIQGAVIEAQGTNSLRTTYDGTLRVQLSPQAIQLVGGSALVANNNGTWQPAPGGIAGSAPANYGGQFTLLFTLGFVAVRDATFDIAAPSAVPLSFGGGGAATFSSAADLTAMAGIADFNHPLATGSRDLAGSTGPNASTEPAMLTIAPGIGGSADAAIQLPIDMEITDIAGTFTFRGSITARATAVAGDANFDGTVNLSDFNTLAGNFGASSGANWLSADFNFDGAVNLSDFNLLAANFGTSTGANGMVDPEGWESTGSAAVPEPAGALVVVLAGTALLWRPRG